MLQITASLTTEFYLRLWCLSPRDHLNYLHQNRYRRMHDLHPKLGSLPPPTCPQHFRLKGSPTVLIHHFHPLSKAGKGRSTCNSLPSTVVIHDPSSSLYSVRLPPINEDRISLSGRMAVKKLREEVYFPFK